MLDLKQTETFRKWRAALRDERAKALIASRVDEGISELRIHHGPGYRLYFQKRGATVIVLLCGGDKGSQARDIAVAKRLADQWSEPDD
jgi:putative addiction module killer protein